MGNKLSVIVKTVQQPLALSRCLASLVAQKMAHDELEIIIVDPSSRRSVHQLVRWWNLSLARQGRRTRLLHVPLRQTNGDADRAGLRASSGTVVAFLDETAAAPPEWAARAIDEMLLRETYPPDIMPRGLARGVVYRRNFVVSSLAMDERAVSNSTLPNKDASVNAISHRRSAPAERAETVQRFRRNSALRSIAFEYYVALTAFIAAFATLFVHQYATAGVAATAALLFIYVAARRRRNGHEAIVRPFAPPLRSIGARSDV